MASAKFLGFVDEATRIEYNVGGVEVVIRDWVGKFLATGVWKKEGIGIKLHVGAVGNARGTPFGE